MSVKVLKAPVMGLATSLNPFSDAPPGSLRRAENVVFSAPQVLSTRPGLEPMSGNFGDSTRRTDSFAFYGDTVYVHDTGGRLYFRDSTSPTGDYTVQSTPWKSTGSFTQRGPGRTRMVLVDDDLFLNTDEGTRMISGEGGYAFPAGQPQGVSLLVLTDGSGTLPWLEQFSQVAYRYTIATYDQFGRLIEGAPSGRTVYPNFVQSNLPLGLLRDTHVPPTCSVDTGPYAHGFKAGDQVTMTPGEEWFSSGTFTVAAVINSHQFVYYDTFQTSSISTYAKLNQVFSVKRQLWPELSLPTGSLTTGSFVKLYRSLMSTGSVAPADSYYLAYQTAFLTGTNIDTRVLVIQDQTPEALLGEPLHTNPTDGDGALQENSIPPLAGDMAFFANRLWYGSTQQFQRFQIQLVGVGYPNGLQVGDDVAIAGVDYVGDDGTGNFGSLTIYSGSDPGTNVQFTAQRLVTLINASTGPVYAYYLSGENDAPGIIGLVARSNSGSVAPFSALSSRPAAWSPQLSKLNAPGNTSDPDYHPARLYYSKLGQPEAVPLLNYLDIGSDAYPILRIYPSTNRLYVFKTDGIYNLFDGFPFTYYKIGEQRLLGTETVGSIGDVIYCLTDQGFVQIRDGVVSPISIAIDSDITARFGDILPALTASAVGIGSQSDRAYFCWVPSSASQTVPDKAYVFSTRAGGWTNFTYGSTAAALDPRTLRVWCALSGNNNLAAFRNTKTSDDYQDYPYNLDLSATCSYLPGQDVTQVPVDSILNTSVGDWVWEDGVTCWRVVDVAPDPVDPTLGTVSVFGSASLAFPGTYRTSKSYQTVVGWNKLTGGSPSGGKRWVRMNVLFGQDDSSQSTLNFSTEADPAWEQVTIQNPTWGSGSWGDFMWGCPGPELRRVEILPQGKNISAQLEIEVQKQEALARTDLLGITVDFDPDSDIGGGS